MTIFVYLTFTRDTGQHSQFLRCFYRGNINGQEKEAQHYHFQIWIANDDNDVEGEWINWYTGEVGLMGAILCESVSPDCSEFGHRE